MTISDVLRAARVQAVNEIRNEVCAERKSSLPTRIGEYLFERLLAALEGQIGDEVTATRVARQKVADEFKVTTDTGSFKNVGPAIFKKLTACRQISADLKRYCGDGVAAKEFLVDGTRYLALVDLPENAGNASRPWQLRVRFRKLGDEPIERPAESGLEDIPDALPLLRIFSAHVKQARQRFASDNEKLIFVNDYAKHIIQSAERAMSRLPDGIAVTPYADFSLLTEFVAALSSGGELIGLTEWPTDRAWWKSSDGQAYIRANQIAIANGATIRRIFVRADSLPQDAVEELAKEVAEHRTMGVEVEVLAASDVIATGRRYESQCVLRTRDDGRSERGWLTYNVRADDHGHPIENVFSIDRETIRQNATLLEELWRKASV